MARPSPEILYHGSNPWRRTYTWKASESGIHDTAFYGSFVKHRIYTGSVTAGYGAMKRRQRTKLSPLSFNMTIRRMYGNPYSERVLFAYYPPYTHTDVSTYDFPNSSILLTYPSSVNHLAEAATKARSRLASQVNGMSMNLGQAFAERRQTAGLMASTITRVTHAALSLRKGRLGDFVTALGLTPDKVSKKSWDRVVRTPPHRRLADHWVEYQYGWKPLLQDLYGASELLSDRIRSDSYHHAIKSSGKAKAPAYSSSKSGGIVTEAWTQHETTHRFAAHFRMDSQAQAALSATGLSNPALLAWELLPYSFVVDWFIPVGNYLEGLTAFDGFYFIGGTESNLSRKQYQQHTYGSTKVNDASYQKTTTVTWSAGFDMTSYDRSSAFGWPAMSKPTFKNPLGGDPLQRVTTALALLTQVFGRK